MRNPLVIGNWKLNGNYLTVKQIVTSLRKKLGKIKNCTVSIAPPEIYLDLAKQTAHGSPIILGSQNVDVNLSGAFTGETSAKMLRDIGVKYVIIGHSERRLYHKETNDFIAKKFFVLKEQDLIPVLCIGETELERKAGNTEKVCIQQLDAILKVQGVTAFKNTVIAYEPVWAIGTGKSANPDQAQEVHKFIRDYIYQFDSKISEKIIIQYGGSVNSSNASKLFAKKDIDGFLVGSASLKVETFLEIIEIAEVTKKNYI